MDKKKEVKKNETLKTYAINLTDIGKRGDLDKVWGRDKEILRLGEILGRRKKNNAVLVGFSGTGKTAIVEGLVQKIINQDVPFGLSNKVIWSLDAGSITAGTQYRGQMEERLKKILGEVEADEDIILFIDEIHMILDSGSSSSLNIANIMKPYLTSGKLQVIGATTHDEYTKIFEKDNALSRRFHKMIIDEPSIKACIDILKNCVPHYEEYHNVKYNEEILNSLPSLAKKYIQDRYLPDSAIDVIDEVGARIKAKRTLPNKKLLKLQQDLVDKEKFKMEIVRNEEWDIVPKFIPELDKLKEKVDIERDKFEIEVKELENYEINESDVLKVLASISNIPLDKLSEDGKSNIKKLAKVLGEKLIGQDEASKLVLKAIKRNVIGFNQPDKPIASFLFLGKTGVGKTEMAKLLSDTWYGKDMIRIDMAEYQDKHSGSGLIGTHAGYVGYEEGGNLTEQVRRNPYSLVLLDEIEKANKDVLNTLLSILDEGFITDGQGRKIDFRNTIIIMTSNLGAKKSEYKKAGYGGGKKVDLNSSSMQSAKEHFTPELWNRIDQVVVFNPLNKDDIAKILTLELNKFKKMLSDKGITITCNKSIKEKLIEEGYDEKLGARPLKRAVQEYLIDEVTDFLLELDDDVEVNKIAVGWNNREGRVDVTVKK
jgi:ATP-dependent Clp protease ATP-binding subunit ClpC